MAESSLEKRLSEIERKRDTLESMIDDKHELIETWDLKNEDFDRDDYDRAYAAALERIQKLTKDLANEISELASFRRKERLTEWPAWWNLWIFGFLAAFVWSFLDWLWEMAQQLLKVLNNPEKVLEIANNILKAAGQGVP